MILRPRFASPKRYSILSRGNKTTTMPSNMVLRPREAYRRRNSPAKKRRIRSKHVSSTKNVPKITPREISFSPAVVATCGVVVQHNNNDTTHNATDRLPETPQQQNLVISPIMPALTETPHHDCDSDSDIAYISDEEVNSFPAMNNCDFV